MQTAVRTLQPQELFALQAENERLLKWEQELMEKAANLMEREERIVSGEVPPPSGGESSSVPSEQKLEVMRLRAMNEELRAQLDMAALNQGAQPGQAELAALKKRMHEAEAQRVLERSEEEARLQRAQAAHRETQDAHEQTAKRLLTLQTAHEHATGLLTSLQAQHDAAVAARTAAERERDRLAELLASQQTPAADLSDAAPSSDAADLRVTLLTAELRQHEASLTEALEAAAANLALRLREVEEAHEASMFAKEHELHRAIAQVHKCLDAETCAEVRTRVVAAELPALEGALHAACAERDEQAARTAAAVQQYEAEAAESLRHEAAATKAEAAKASAEERTRRLQERLEQANARRVAAEDLAARGEAALARMARLEEELSEALALVARLQVEQGRLETEAAERETKHEAAVARVREQAKEGLKMREALLKEAVARAEAAQKEADELREQMEKAASDEEIARDGEEMAMHQLKRLEKQLEAARKELQRKDDSIQAMARRLEVLAGTHTESHMHDMGYWSERSKRTDFATAAFTVGSSKKAALKATKEMTKRANALGPATGGGAAAAGLPPVPEREGKPQKDRRAARRGSGDSAEGGGDAGGGTTLPPIKV